MAPTRELVQQIGKEARRFMKPLGLTCTCIYGGSGVANQVRPLQQPAPLQLYAVMRCKHCRLSLFQQAATPSSAAQLQDSTCAKHLGLWLTDHRAEARHGGGGVHAGPHDRHPGHISWQDHQPAPRHLPGG